MTMANIKTAAVIGTPIHHSLSPHLHGFWLKEMGINGQYERIEVTESGLADFMRNLPSSHLKGINITIPHKQAALEFCDNIDATAKKVGAVNTVWIDNNKLHATNSDVYGFRCNLSAHIPFQNMPKRTAVVLGAGGAARAVICALQEIGFAHIKIANRTILRAEQLVNDMMALALNDGNIPSITVHALENISDILHDADLLVNTTSIGMATSTKQQNHQGIDFLNFNSLPPHAIVTDIVYTPLITPFLEKAAACGYYTIDGLGMLLYQAIPGFQKWFSPPHAPHVSDALRAHMIAQLNG
jgi:shikimate dehydrogenase